MMLAHIRSNYTSTGVGDEQPLVDWTAVGTHFSTILEAFEQLFNNFSSKNLKRVAKKLLAVGAIGAEIFKAGDGNTPELAFLLYHQFMARRSDIVTQTTRRTAETFNAVIDYCENVYAWRRAEWGKEISSDDIDFLMSDDDKIEHGYLALNWVMRRETGSSTANVSTFLYRMQETIDELAEEQSLEDEPAAIPTDPLEADMANMPDW